MSLDGLLNLDSRLSARLRVAEQPGLLRTTAVVLAHSGDSWFWLAGLVLAWFVRIPYWQVRVVALATGIILTALVVLVLKFSIRRSRPQGDWGNIYRKSDPHSFPSGHAARAFMLAIMVMAMGPGWLALVLSVWAPLVSLARIAMGLHYLSDVVAGMSIGTVMGWVVLRFLQV